MSFLPENYFYLFIVAAIFQGALILVLVFLFFDKFLNSKLKRTQDQLIKEDAYNQAIKILEDAKKTSFESVKVSQAKADQILSQTEFLTSHIKQSFDETLNVLVEKHQKTFTDLSNDLISIFKQAFEKEEVTTISNYNSASLDIRNELLSHIKEFANVLQRHTIETEELLKGELSKDVNSMKDRLASYENTSMKKIEDSMYVLLLDASKQIMGKSLTVDNQEEYIMKVIKDAEENNYFKN